MTLLSVQLSSFPVTKSLLGITNSWRSQFVTVVARICIFETTPVDPSEADDRLQRLQALLTEQQRETQAAMVGRTVNVLFEKPGRLPDQMVGKSEYLHAVHVQAARMEPGDILPVKIVRSNSNSLAGELIGDPATVA